MEGRLRLLLVVEHLLIELLTITKTRELNLHVLGTRELNHSRSQVSNLHRLSHIEHEDLTTITLGSCLQHQLTGLRNQHEVTHNTLISYSHRTTIANLLTEQRDHRTIRAQHITESCGHKLRIRITLLLEQRRMLLQLLNLQLAVERLYVDLTDTLRATHHVRWVHGLISRYHHKLLHAVFHAQVSDHLRTIYIIKDRLAGVVLHHRHMLIGSSMEHVVRTERLKHLLHTRIMTDARHQSFRLYIREFPFHHQADIVLRRLSLVYQHHGSRLIHSYLTHHLRTDTTRSTCNHDTLTTQQFTH